MNIVNQIAQDLALRLPQKAALKVLDAVLSDIPDLRVSLPEIEAEVAGRGGFERFDTEFPSFGFHIATAVGKTRLMGATIAYLHKTRGYRNFFILTKGSTVYRKTIDNFSRGHGKYALEGYTEMPPFELITGEDYNPDFIADDGTTLYLLEVKSAAELTNEIVQRKAHAAHKWCQTAPAPNNRQWEYKLLPHDSIYQTDSFAGVLSKEYKIPSPLVSIQNRQPDKFFTQTQQARLAELVQRRQARLLTVSETSELESLISPVGDG